MKQITREWLAFLREQYPVGSRIRLNSMEDPYAPVEPGTMGTLQRIDDAGQFLMKWDNGRTLSLIPGEDSFSLILPEPTMMKLYMPLHADLYTKDDWSDTSEEPEMLTGRALMEYEDSILIALIKNRMSEEAERGIMRWYGREDSVDRKVKSVVFTAEEREGQLWGVAECKVVGELTPEELDTLKDYISGQASDGWGEGFEQREIQVDDGELYVHLWNFGDWSIQTEEECFSPKLAEGLPDMCFSTLKSTGDLICIKRGESGYYPSDWNTADKARNEDMADELNGKLGVTSAQRQAMEVGSMAGWNVPGANPAANDFYRFCALGYAANNYDGQAFALKAQYYRHADGRDDGLKKIDPDSAEAFAGWLENREKGGHPWEVCRGGNSTHVSLYVGLGRVAEGCYHLALAAKSYGRCVEAIKFYLALKHAGLPVIIYGAEFIKKRLLGLERVGIVPNEVMPFYCHSRFPGEDVDSFRHLNHENPDAEIALIEWQPIKPVKLKENAHE